MEQPATRNEVVVVDVKMPFLSMVVFMVKWAIAAIPALIVLAVFGWFLSSIFLGLMHGIDSQDMRLRREVYPDLKREVYPPRGSDPKREVYPPSR